MMVQSTAIDTTEASDKHYLLRWTQHDAGPDDLWVVGPFETETAAMRWNLERNAFTRNPVLCLPADIAAALRVERPV